VEDIIKNKPSSQRSSLLTVNEDLYIGGLQPTLLSSAPFGGVTSTLANSSCAKEGAIVAQKEARLRRRLVFVNKKLDKKMERMHEEKMAEAKIARDVLKKRREEKKKRAAQQLQMHGVAVKKEEEEEVVEDEYHLLVERREALLVASSSLTAPDPSTAVGASTNNPEKWSLRHAYLLHAPINDYIQHYHPSFSAEESFTIHREINMEKEALLKKLSKSTINSLHTFYTTYLRINSSLQTLSLPQLISKEVIHYYIQYVIHKNGIHVRGVSTSSSGAGDKKDKREEKERLRQQKQDNDYIMGGSLGSALIYVVGKKLGWGRSLMDVCDSFNPQDDDEEKNDEKQQVKKKKKKKRLLIKPKHCCRAMNEVKVIFPHLFQNAAAAAAAAAAAGVTSSAIVPDVTTSSSSSTAMAHVKQEEGTTVSSPPPPPPSSNTIMTTSNQMTQHSIRNLSLPPITQNMICILTHHILTEQRTKGRDSGIKPNVIVGGVTYMICSAGLIMERLAKQACSSSSGARNGWKKNGVLIQSKRKLEEKEMEVNDSKKRRKQEDPNETTNTVNPQEEEEEDTKRPAEEKLLAGRADDTTDVLPPLLQPTLEDVDDILLSSSSTATATTSFDVLSHKPINQNVGKSASSYTTAQEQDELHSWEAWKHHFSTSSSSSSWHRSLPHIAKQLKISKHSLYDYYRKSIFKRRLELLQSLRKYEREEEEEQEEEKWMRKSMMAAAPLMTLPSKG